MVLRKPDVHMQKMETRFSRSPYVKINQLKIDGSNIQLDTLKLLDDSMGKTCQDTGMDNDFLQRI